jgi:hypothetical protein
MVINGAMVRWALYRPGAGVRAQLIARPRQSANRNRSQTKFGISWPAESPPLAWVGKVTSKAPQAGSFTLNFDSLTSRLGRACARQAL